jgi:hypothetical protein
MNKPDNDYGPIIDILEDILGGYHMHNDYKAQISFDCPVCSHEIKGLDEGDGKGNLEVNYRMRVYKCWSCSDTHDTRGSLYWLVKKYGNKRHLKMYELLMPEDVPLAKREYKKVQLPKEYIGLKDCRMGIKLTHHYKQAVGYLKKRGVSDELISRFNIGFAHEGAYSGRIIIPSYDKDGVLNYFIARSYLSYSKLKYKNPEVQKEIIIFNENLINWDERLYIVEGAFDSIFLKNSIPMLGKVMSEHLFEVLYDKAKELVIVLDGDAWDNAVKLFHKLNNGRLFGKVWVVKMPIENDIADLRGNLSELKEMQLD